MGNHRGLIMEDIVEKKVAVLDCETLSLSTRALVYEVAVEIRVVNEWYEQSAKTAASRSIWNMDVVEQMVMGREVSKDTLAFQQRKIPNFLQVLTEGTRCSVQYMLEQLITTLQGMDEVWIYKASFDHSVLHSLAEDVRFPHVNLWGHDAERCLKTTRLEFKPQLDALMEAQGPRKAAHRAGMDCGWNWEVLEAYGTLRRAWFPSPKG